MGRCQTHQKAGVNFMVVEAALPTNPEKVRDGKRKTNYSERPRHESTGDYKCTIAWSRMNRI